MHSPAQLKHDAVPASNSDFSEDDIPLNVRSGNGNEREKDARPKKTGFVIPRKKKRSEGECHSASGNGDSFLCFMRACGHQIMHVCLCRFCDHMLRPFDFGLKVCCCCKALTVEKGKN